MGIYYNCVIGIWAAVDFKMCFGDDVIDFTPDTTSDIIAGGIGELLVILCCKCCEDDEPPPIQEQVRYNN